MNRNLVYSEISRKLSKTKQKDSYLINTRCLGLKHLEILCSMKTITLIQFLNFQIQTVLSFSQFILSKQALCTIYLIHFIDTKSDVITSDFLSLTTENQMWRAQTKFSAYYQYYNKYWICDRHKNGTNIEEWASHITGCSHSCLNFTDMVEGNSDITSDYLTCHQVMLNIVSY